MGHYPVFHLSTNGKLVLLQILHNNPGLIRESLTKIQIAGPQTTNLPLVDSPPAKIGPKDSVISF